LPTWGGAEAISCNQSSSLSIQFSVNGGGNGAVGRVNCCVDGYVELIRLFVIRWKVGCDASWPHHRQFRSLVPKLNSPSSLPASQIDFVSNPRARRCDWPQPWLQRASLFQCPGACFLSTKASTRTSHTSLRARPQFLYPLLPSNPYRCTQLYPYQYILYRMSSLP
jgi:hypothetical protein